MRIQIIYLLQASYLKDEPTKQKKHKHPTSNHPTNQTQREAPWANAHWLSFGSSLNPANHFKWNTNFSTPHQTSMNLWTSPQNTREKNIKCPKTSINQHEEKLTGVPKHHKNGSPRKPIETLENQWTILENQWNTHRKPMENQWNTHRKPMENQWKTYGKRMENLRKLVQTT